MMTKRDAYSYILGLGKSGLSTVNYLQKHQQKVLAWDDNPVARDAVSEDILQAPETLPWEKLQEIILSPGIPHSGPSAHPLLLEAKKRGIPLTVDVELFLKKMDFQPQHHVIGITGTNGKSTTTSLLAHLLSHFGKKAVAAGNIGVPILSLPSTFQETYFVLELSSYQLSLIKTPALDLGILLNISPDHLEYHGSMDAYIHAKMKIFSLKNPESHAKGILGVDDPYTQEIHQKNPSLLSVSSKSSMGAIFIKDSQIVDTIHNQTIPLPGLKNLQGDHNAQNILACYAALRQILLKDFTVDGFIEGLKTFKSLPHRQEIVAEHQGITFINDSKATNMDAAEKSLKVFKNIHWILGGKAKTGETPLSLKPLFDHVKHVYLVGSSMDAFEKEIKGTLPYTLSHTVDAATKAAYQNAAAGDVILLAPACASFDQFKNFEERGNLFKAYATTLLGGDHE